LFFIKNAETACYARLGFGDRHIACWQSIKVTDHIEETEEDGTVTIRDRERFTQRLTLIYRDGRTAVLG
jgi:hypothetical protein